MRKLWVLLGSAVFTGVLLLGAVVQPVMADDGIRKAPENVQLAQRSPFSGFVDSILGGGRGGSTLNKGQPAQKNAPVMSGDPLANALRQIDVAKGIQQKARQLEESVSRVIYTVKLYQALNGGIWYKLGLQLNEVYKLNDRAEAGWVKEFIAATKYKRVSGQKALQFVEVNAVDDIRNQNHTISANNAKIAVLRKSVAAYANAVAGQGSFEKLVADQTIPLDGMMNAYLSRVEDITATMGGAAIVFDEMSKSYARAVYDMDVAIRTFEEQSGLVAAEVTKQIGILALEIGNMKTAIDNARNNPFGAILVLAQGMTILSDLNDMQTTLNEFNKTKEWFDANAQEILAASQGARQELAASLDTLKVLRPTLAKSWKRQCSAVSKAAAQLRKETVAFEAELEKVRQKAQRKAPAVGKSEMAEFDSLLKKPRRLKKSS